MFDAIEYIDDTVRNIFGLGMPLGPIEIDPIIIEESDNQGHPVPGLMFIDVSHHEDCDFSQIELKDIIFKATDGLSFIDPTLKQNIKDSSEYSKRVSAYHFFRTKYRGRAQARFFMDTVGIENIKSMYHLPVLDFEEDKKRGQKKRHLKKTIDEALIFCQEIYKVTGRKVRIYTGDYLMGYLKFDKRFLECCDLPWVARYSKKKPKNSGPWGAPWAWQFTSKGQIKGVDGNCDVNYFM